MSTDMKEGPIAAQSWYILEALRRTVQAAGGDLADVEADRPLIRARVSRQHADQGRLSGAVLADERMYFAAAQIERDAIERAHAGIGFGNVFHGQTPERSRLSERRSWVAIQSDLALGPRHVSGKGRAAFHGAALRSAS
jgi:hypothetical protein